MTIEVGQSWAKLSGLTQGRAVPRALHPQGHPEESTTYKKPGDLLPLFMRKYDAQSILWTDKPGKKPHEGLPSPPLKSTPAPSVFRPDILVSSTWAYQFFVARTEILKEMEEIQYGKFQKGSKCQMLYNILVYAEWYSLKVESGQISICSIHKQNTNQLPWKQN